MRRRTWESANARSVRSTGLLREDLPQDEYALTGICGGELMMQGVMFCAPCIEQTNDLVSKKTRDVWRRFIDENFPGVPADALPDPARIPVF